MHGSFPRWSVARLRAGAEAPEQAGSSHLPTRSPVLSALLKAHLERRRGPRAETARDTCPMDLEVVTAASRRDLEHEAKTAFRDCWPEFMFHDAISREP